MTERDVALLKSLDRYALMTSRQIHNLHFQSIDNHTMLRRLRILEKRKFIQRHSGLENGKLTWTLAQKGLALLGSQSGITINRNTLRHDSLIAEVRILLDRLGIGKKWTGYHELRLANTSVKPEERSQDVIPDSMFGVVQNGVAKFVALEVELIAKSRKRYRKILDLYSHKKSINHIWYVIAPPNLGKLLHLEVEKIQRAMPDDWLIWTTLDDLLANQLDAKIHFKNGKCQSLKDFAPPSKQLKPQTTLPTQPPPK